MFPPTGDYICDNGKGKYISCADDDGDNGDGYHDDDHYVYFYQVFNVCFSVVFVLVLSRCHSPQSPINLRGSSDFQLRGDIFILVPAVSICWIAYIKKQFSREQIDNTFSASFSCRLHQSLGFKDIGYWEFCLKCQRLLHF